MPGGRTALPSTAAASCPTQLRPILLHTALSWMVSHLVRLAEGVEHLGRAVPLRRLHLQGRSFITSHHKTPAVLTVA